MTYKKKKHFAPFYNLATGLINFALLIWITTSQNRGNLFLWLEALLWQQHPPLPSDALYWFEQCLTAVIQRATPSCYLDNKKVLNPSLFQLFCWERELRNTKGLVRKVNKRERQKGNNVEPAALSPLTLPWLRSRTLSTVGSTRALFFRGGCGVSPLLVPSPGPGAEKQKVIPVDQRLCCKNTND